MTVQFSSDFPEKSLSHSCAGNSTNWAEGLNDKAKWKCCPSFLSVANPKLWAKVLRNWQIALRTLSL